MATGRNTENKDSVLEFAALEADAGVATCTSNACTLNKAAGQITTESLTTASGASQAITITNALVDATCLALVQHAGGGNTRIGVQFRAVCTAGVLTVTIDNSNAAALNGTIIFNYLLVCPRPASVL